QRFRAVIMHSGIPPGTAHSRLSALGAMHGHRDPRPLPSSAGETDTRWPPLLVIHGDMDTVVSPRNGHAAAQIWAHAAGARASSPRSIQRGRRYPMSVTDFKRQGRTVATLVTVNGLAHAWSGGAKQAFSDGQGPDASRMAWSFAARQFRSEV
ncbi:MAG TPA: PHB depolymerase family esterase, partial [Aquabacterium sp.]|nr:PHB depolymerase family esterase [Aquabacterium sp.]